MNIIKKSIFLLILLFLLFSAIQGKFHLIRPALLNGYFVPVMEPVFSMSSWFSGAYQDSCSKFVKENTGFRSNFVLLYNQVDYSLFSVPHAQKIIVGKSGYLYSDEYISAYMGTNFTGKQFCDEKVRLLKKLQDLLWNEYKIFLVVIMTPDKGNFYPEYIPDRYLKQKKENTNYGYSAEKCAEAGINMIDFNRSFCLAKKTSHYPLYPKTGIHWSSYGAVLAADSLLKYLKAKLNIQLPALVIDSIQTSAVALDIDDDIESTMNLIWKLPHPVYGYARYHFSSDSTRKKPAALFVGDSFYWSWYPQFIKGAFSNDDFWFYNMEAFPESRIKPTQVPQIDIAKAIKRQNIIVLIQVNGAKGNIGYGFIDQALSVLDPEKTNELKQMEESIRGNTGWMKMIREKAAKNHFSVDEQLKMDALFMLDLQKKENQHKNK